MRERFYDHPVERKAKSAGERKHRSVLPSLLCSAVGLHCKQHDHTITTSARRDSQPPPATDNFQHCEATVATQSQRTHTYNG
jgi:hypothetical protein